MLQNIAVGIDDSSAACGALAWASRLAEGSDASLMAIHSWEAPFVCTYPGASPSTEDMAAHARVVIRSALDTAGVADVVESVIVQGASGPTVVEQSRRSDLVVVGCTGGGLQRLKPELGEVLFGSTARYAVHHCEVPVAAIPEGAQWQADPVVAIGVDGSPASLAALQWAVAELPASSELHVIQAIEYPCTGGGVPVDVEMLDPLVADYQRSLDGLVSSALGSNDASQTIATHVVLGVAADALVDPDRHADIIVIGEHGTTAASKQAIGSVSDHTLRHAAVPVIVVPAP